MPIVVTCPNCQMENPGSRLTCLECSANLVDLPRQEVGAPIQPAAAPKTIYLKPANLNPVQSPAGAAQDVAYRLAKTIESSANNFYWIAGLSLINTLGSYANASISFIMGLGITQFIDEIGQYIANDLGGNAGKITLAIAFALDLLFVGFFILCGVFARRGKMWAFVVGMVFYALDALLYLLLISFDVFHVLLNVGFHVFFLYGIFRGFNLLRKIRKTRTEATICGA